MHSMIQLSERLRALAELVETGSRLADIGSDHALLPSFLAERGVVSFAVAGELNPGPFEAAGKQVREAGLAGLISVRRGDGLEVVRPGEVDTVTIAGMGGNLITQILSAGAAEGKLQGVRRLILQPNVGEEAVRRWLSGNGWFLAGEQILEEDGKTYEVLWAVPADPGQSGRGNSALYVPWELSGFGTVGEDLQYRFGPYLMRDVSPVFIRKWEREIRKLERIASQLEESRLEEAAAKRQQMLEDIGRVKELIACLPKDEPSFN